MTTSRIATDTLSQLSSDDGHDDLPAALAATELTDADQVE